MKKDSLIIFIIALIIVAVLIGIRIFLLDKEPADPKLIDLAKCLAEKNVVMYGAEWCRTCQGQKAIFGEAFKFVPYIECPDETKKCTDLGINALPTWIFSDSKRIEGILEPLKLAEESGCPFNETQN